MTRIVLDSMPTVKRQGAGRKPTIVLDAPEIVSAAGKTVVFGPFLQSTASNRAKQLRTVAVDGGAIVASTRHDLGNGTVAPEKQAFVCALFVAAAPKRVRKAKVTA